MADRNYYAHQHSQGATKDDGNVVALSSRYTRADGAGAVDSGPKEGIARAVGNVMAPYAPPARRGRDSEGRKLCAEDECKAFPIKEHDYCIGHARSRGLVENWSTSKKKDAADATE